MWNTVHFPAAPLRKVKRFAHPFQAGYNIGATRQNYTKYSSKSIIQHSNPSVELTLGQSPDMLGNNLERWLQIFSGLAECGLSLHARQCSRLRHRQAACTLCADYCPTQAITWDDTLQINPEKCIACGLCASACPTGALEALSPSNRELLVELLAYQQQQATAVFVCPHFLEENKLDGEGFIGLNCLGRLDESVLVAGVALGLQELYLVDGACDSCPQRCGADLFRQAATRSEQLLRAAGSGGRIIITPTIPLEARPLPAPVTAAGFSRRGFFKMLLTGAAQGAAAVTEDTLSGWGLESEEPPSPAAELPRRLPVKRQLLLAALRRLGSPAPESRLSLGGLWAQFGSSKACTGCQMCAVFCPTGALKKIERENQAGVTFSLAACTDCRLCDEICYVKAVELAPDISLGKALSQDEEVYLMRPTGATPWSDSPESPYRRMMAALPRRIKRD
jgi:formate hydrogenlyase subunit 6/NADH:ubiquinone oxidoreductase subunit I